jgi:rapamycin-insensitive companion of mTOR
VRCHSFSHSLHLTSFRSLTLDKQHTVEKEQAIKLIRTIVEIGAQRNASKYTAGSGKVPLSEAVMRAFVAVAEQIDDPFKTICVETLAEIRQCIFALVTSMV